MLNNLFVRDFSLWNKTRLRWEMPALFADECPCDSVHDRRAWLRVLVSSHVGVGQARVAAVHCLRGVVIAFVGDDVIVTVAVIGRCIAVLVNIPRQWYPAVVVIGVTGTAGVKALVSTFLARLLARCSCAGTR